MHLASADFWLELYLPLFFLFDVSFLGAVILLAYYNHNVYDHDIYIPDHNVTYMVKFIWSYGHNIYLATTTKLVYLWTRLLRTSDHFFNTLLEENFFDSTGALQESHNCSQINCYTFTWFSNEGLVLEDGKRQCTHTVWRQQEIVVDKTTPKATFSWYVLCCLNLLPDSVNL